MPEVFVGLGSNIEPEEHIPCAVRGLRRIFGDLCLSPVYRCPAFGMRGADFLNMVASFESELPIDAIDRMLTELEADAGRVRSTEVVSRTLDLDLLLYGSRVDPAHRVPRDDVLRYAFVLGPLADIAPDLRHPLTGETIRSAWTRMAVAGHSLLCLGSVDAM